MLVLGKEGSLGLVDFAKLEGSILGTSRLAGRGVLDNRKPTMYEAYGRFFKPTYRDAVNPILAVTDSVILHNTSPSVACRYHADRRVSQCMPRAV